MRLLVLNCFSRNSLAVIDGLDPGVELIGGAPRRAERRGGWREWLRSPRLRSVFHYTPPERDRKAFRDDLVEACRRLRPDGVFPTGTAVTNALSHYKREIEEGTGATMLVDEPERLMRLTDKWRGYRLCLEAGVPAPRTALFPLPGDPLAPLRELRFPIVVKPRMSWAARGVRFFDDLDGVRRALEEDPELGDAVGEDPPLIAQEKIEGDLHDVALCASRGRAVRIFSQRRVVSLYDFGGGGIVNVTTDEPEAMAHARRLVAHVGWSGPALFDFMKDGEGRHFLLEVNPKIWGTTQLGTECGQNVPQAVVEVFLGTGEPVPKESYEVGLLYRWIFPECVFHWAQRPRGPARVLRRMTRTLRRHGARRTLHNLRRGDLRHLLGEVLN